MKKQAGRPRIGAQHAKGVFITARFTPSESNQIEAAISKSGLTKSKFVRKALLSASNVLNV